MTPKINYQVILAISISLAVIACNDNGNKTAEAATDSTSGAKTDSVQPAAPAMAMDAAQAAPNLYHVAADSLGIRILKATYHPGDSSAMHSHPDNAVYIISGGNSTFTLQDGKTVTMDMQTGMTGIHPEESHSVKNIGKTTEQVLLVEVNRPQGTPSPNTNTDATKVAPGLYKLKNDTMGIRVVEATYKPGQSSAMHAHPDNAVYVISGGNVEFTEKDGTKHSHEFKAGMTMIAPAGEHSVKNTGKTTLKVLLVEVNRPRK